MKRNTIQKNIIYNALKEMNNHPTASQLYNYIHNKYPSISKATVFRVLNDGCEEKKVMKVNINDNESHYEIINPPHYHMHCRKCSKIFDATINYIEDLNSGIQNFFVEGHNIEFYGLCSECLKIQGGKKHE